MGYISILQSWLSYFLKQHGLKKTIIGISLYHYRIIKLQRLDVSKENQVITNGCKLSLIPNDKGISEELLLFNTHEPLNTQALSHEIKEGMTCLDIGGNIGYYATLESKLVGKEGRVIAIEPSPLNFRYLKKNMSLQENTNYTVHNFACGNETGEVNFLLSKKSNLSKVISDGEEIPPDCEIIKIPLKKIDSFLEEEGNPKIDMLRMDVEGYEMMVLEGAHNCLVNYKPIIQIEIHTEILGSEKTKRILLYLKDLGYEIKWYTPREIDFPLLGNKNDIKKYKIDTVLQKLNSNTLPRNFIILLTSKTKTN